MLVKKFIKFHANFIDELEKQIIIKITVEVDQ